MSITRKTVDFDPVFSGNSISISIPLYAFLSGATQLENHFTAPLEGCVPFRLNLSGPLKKLLLDSLFTFVTIAEVAILSSIWRGSQNFTSSSAHTIKALLGAGLNLSIHFLLIIGLNHTPMRRFSEGVQDFWLLCIFGSTIGLAVVLIVTQKLFSRQTVEGIVRQAGPQFNQPENKVDSAYYINIPTPFVCKSKEPKGAFNSSIPLRATAGLSEPNSPKAYSIASIFISTSQKGFLYAGL